MSNAEDYAALVHEVAYKTRCRNLTVFVSSTFQDFEKERLAVRDAINICGCHPKLAENAEMLAGRSLIQHISYWLSNVDILVLLVAERYGGLSPSKLSWTEEEVRHAADSGVLLLPYFIDRDDGRNYDLERSKGKKLSRFKRYLELLPNQKTVQAQLPQYAKDTTDLCIRVARDIAIIQSDYRIAEVVESILNTERAKIEDRVRASERRERAKQKNAYYDGYTD